MWVFMGLFSLGAWRGIINFSFQEALHPFIFTLAYFFLGGEPQCMEDPRRGVELELQLPA